MAENGASASAATHEKQTTQVKAHEKRKNRRLAFLQSVNVRLDPSSVSHRAIVHHPGLPPQIVDRDGNPSLIGLVRVARMVRTVAMATPCTEDNRTFVHMEELRENKRTVFMAAALYTINENAYNTDIPKFPLRALLELGHVGRTSFSIQTTITTESGEEILTCVNQLVLIDPTTRRPTPLPESWRQHYSPLCVRPQPLIVPRQDPPEPQHDHRYSLTVVYSDTDDNDHTNFSSYIRFALDALYHTLREGVLEDNVTAEDVAAGTSEVRVAYLGESSEGDVLTVHVFCVTEKERTVVCSMDRDTQPVCQVRLSFNAASY